MLIQDTSSTIVFATTSARLVNSVYDEIIECARADAYSTASILENAMCAAGREFVQKVPVKVDVHVADEWAK